MEENITRKDSLAKKYGFTTADFEQIKTKGISLDKIETEFGSSYLDYLHQQAEKYILDNLLEVENNILIISTSKEIQGFKRFQHMV
jgi:coproporphyrinogen III oxidase-like Fe-S oxidoreductase